MLSCVSGEFFFDLTMNNNFYCKLKKKFNGLTFKSLLHYSLQDVGSNVGVQVRKLFELDNKFPDATITKMFDSHFGPHNEKRNNLG